MPESVRLALDLNLVLVLSDGSGDFQSPPDQARGSAGGDYKSPLPFRE